MVEHGLQSVTPLRCGRKDRNKMYEKSVYGLLMAQSCLDNLKNELSGSKFVRETEKWLMVQKKTET